MFSIIQTMNKEQEFILNEKKDDDVFDLKNDQYIEIPWTIIETYFKGQHLDRLIRHQLESYNNFVSCQIQKTIEMFNPVRIASEQDYDAKSGKYSLEIYVTFENFHIYRPQIHENNGATKLMFPQEARLRNFTYASSMTIDMNLKFMVRNGPNLENIQTFYKNLPKIHIGKLPIMLKSNICVLNQYKHVDNSHTGECKFDAGGYFIINGSEKTVLGQERAAENRVYCFNVSKNNTKYTWMAEVKSVPDFKCISPKQINMMISSKNNGFGCPLYLQLPRVKQPLPLFIVFRALGVLSDKDICEHILLDIEDEKNKELLKALQASIIESNTCMTKEDAIKYITSYVMFTPINMDKETGIRKKAEFTADILSNDLFPHCTTVEQKIYFLGYTANMLLKTSFDLMKQDDRDSYLNKRVDLTGALLNNLFRNYFNKLVKDMEKQVVKEINTGSWRSTDDYLNIINMTNIYKIIKSTTIENGIKRALSTGDFGIKHVNNSNKVGVAQVLNRLTYVSSLSHARRISTPVDKSGKLIPPRKLHNTSWGFLCPAECFDPETPILMWDGTSKRAGDIVVDDVLVDDLGKPTTVRTTCAGFKNMYDVIPEKGNFIKHRVTDNHILTLRMRQHKNILNQSRKDRKYTHSVKFLDRESLKIQEKYFVSLDDAENFVDSFQDDDTLDITIENYLKLDQTTKDHLVLFKVDGIEDSNFDLVEAGIGPYVGWQLHDKRGRFCLIDGLVVHNTPEGQSVGVVKNLSYMTHVTIHSNSGPLYDYVLPSIIPVQNLTAREMYEKTKVFINGAWVGISENPVELYQMLKEKKYMGIINVYTSIVFDYKFNEIRVCNDAGRLTRPLLRVRDNNILIKKRVIDDIKSGKVGWNDLITNCSIGESIIEYIDPEEQSWSMIAMKPTDLIDSGNEKEMFKHTHCEIHPSTIFGVLASCIPFPEHNQSPRNTYQCLDINETVLMSDYSRKKIGDINIGDEVVSFDPETMEISNTKVTHHYIRKTDKKIYKLTTLSGREIIATEDHKFMTYDGWREVREMICSPNDNKIGIFIDTKNDYETEQSKVGENYKLETKGCAMFIPLDSIVELDNCLISDITVESDNHSFIAGNNFLSSNCAQAKQAMGVYVTNFDNRMDKTAYVLNTPARPLVDTRIMDMIKINKIPSGFNVVVAIMTHTGYNQEDSLLFNKGSIDRGLFQATIYHTEKDEDKQKINGDEEIRCKPDPTKTKGMKFANYQKVNNRGVIPENTLVENRDVIISKVVPIKENRNDHTKLIKYEDQSRIYRTDEETYIDKNYIDRNGDGYNFAKVRLRTVRKPVIGDKFSSRSGQKGTIGNIIPEEDMPFTASGIRPDIILNPHAIPSRMTIAHLKETIMTKVLVQLGLFGDGTSFGELEIHTICEELLRLGYESRGNELLYNGLTGEQHECSIFMGPIFYQRLKHMVNDKQHSRSIGPMVNLTRQPAEGRSRDGGLRFGEMERDAMISHGASRFTKGRMYDASDKYHVYSCNKCGMIATYNDEMHIHICRTCENRTDFSYVEIPYACKLLFQELMTMNIAPRIMTTH